MLPSSGLILNSARRRRNRNFRSSCGGFIASWAAYQYLRLNELDGEALRNLELRLLP